MSINNMEYILSISILLTVDLSHLKSLNFDFMDYSTILFSTTRIPVKVEAKGITHCHHNVYYTVICLCICMFKCMLYNVIKITLLSP